MPDAAWKEKNIPLLMALFRLQFYYTDLNGRLRSFSAFVLSYNILRDETELINYETVSMKYCECMSVFFP
jgi:hypothetical protein